jgi:hypothetical protein
VTVFGCAEGCATGTSTLLVNNSSSGRLAPLALFRGDVFKPAELVFLYMLNV